MFEVKDNRNKTRKNGMDYLNKNNITYEYQKLMYDKFVVDFYLPSYNKVIEVFGDYWHANPKIYTNKEMLNEFQIKQIKKDKARINYLKKCGHDVHILWESDVYNNIDELFKNII